MEDCTSSSSTIRVQTSCKQEDEELTQAHVDEDILEICRKMAVMFKCAVTSLPRCYDYFEASTFSMYFHSPFSCDLSEQQIMELQDIHNKGAEPATVMASSSSPVTETSYSTSTTTSAPDEEEVTYSIATSSLAATQQWLQNETVAGRSAGRTVTDYDKAGHSRNEEQKGSLSHNAAAVLGRFPFLFLVIWSRTLSWRLTS